jgi:hypothetical protein
LEVGFLPLAEYTLLAYTVAFTDSGKAIWVTVTDLGTTRGRSW